MSDFSSTPDEPAHNFHRLQQMRYRLALCALAMAPLCQILNIPLIVGYTIHDDVTEMPEPEMSELCFCTTRVVRRRLSFP